MQAGAIRVDPLPPGAYLRAVRPALIAMLLCASPALALDEPKLHLALDGGYACFADTQRHHGIGGAAELGYAFDGFWVVRAGYGLGQHVSKGDAFFVHQLNLGVRYQLDVFEYVPWIELSPGVYLADGDGGPAAGGGVRAGLGFDWLIDPSWSLGFNTHLHQLAMEGRFPAYFTAGARLGYRWSFGDPFAP